jgi:hypothetical protein
MQNGIDWQPSRNSISRRRLLIGASAAGFVITLSIVIAAGRSPRPAVQSVSVAPPAPVHAPEPRPAAMTPVTPVAPVTVELTPLPKWVGRRQPKLTGDWTKTVSFSLDAIADVTVGTSRTRPQLVARCLSRMIEVYVVTGPLSFESRTGSHTVRVQMDDDPVQPQQWLDSEGSRELFAPDGAALSDRLAEARRLRVGFTPFSARPVTAEFIVEGFDELAPLIARTCGRRPSSAGR